MVYSSNSGNSCCRTVTVQVVVVAEVEVVVVVGVVVVVKGIIENGRRNGKSSIKRSQTSTFFWAKPVLFNPISLFSCYFPDSFLPL